jgi:hypothetical protein
MSANDSVESLGALQSVSGVERGSQEDKAPHLECQIKTFHVMDRGPGGIPRTLGYTPLYLPSLS